MGTKTSFITNYCTQVRLEITQQNLLSQGFQLLQNVQTSNFCQYGYEKRQFYQNFQTKKLFSLQKIKCPKKQAQIMYKAMQNLEIIKKQYICNVIFSSIDKTTFNLLAKENQIKVFTEFSPLNLNDFLEKKIKQKKQYQKECEDQNFSFSNIQIANFMYTLSGLAGQIQFMRLPIEKLEPKRFLMMQNQGGRIKYDLDFQQIMLQNKNNDHNGYFSSEVWDNMTSTSSFADLNQNLWQEQYEKKLIFALGMLSLHFLLLQSNQDCYNYKSKQFCKSQLENKLDRLSNMLQKRFQAKQLARDQSYNTSLGTYVDKLHTEQITDEFQSFEFILYETIISLLAETKQNRISVNQLKKRSKALMNKVRQQYTVTKSDHTFVSNIQKAQQKNPKINSSYFSQARSFQHTQGSYIKKVSSLHQNTSESNGLKFSKRKSMTTNLRPKKISIKQKCQNSNKQNIVNNELQKAQKNGLKGSIRKLSGYKKIQTSDYSFLEGYFENDMAHGLGKMTNKNGQITECIFHNNQIIEQIHPVTNGMTFN